MNNSNKYKIYNLVIRSEIELPELMVEFSDRIHDVELILGKTPTKLSGSVVSKVQAQIAPNQFLFKVEDIASYYVTNGDKIVVEPSQKENFDAIRLFLFGSVMASLLYQRNCFLLHASAVQKNGIGYAFVGRSGYGKSTTAAALIDRGYHLVTDDVCMIQTDPDSYPILWTSYPGMKLWDDSLDYLQWRQNGRNESLNIRNVRNGIDKYRVDLLPDKEYTPGSFKLEIIYFLSFGDDEPSIVEIEGIDRMKHLYDGGYRTRQLDGLGGKDQHFLSCYEIARKVKLRKVTRTHSTQNVDGFIDLICENIESSIHE